MYLEIEKEIATLQSQIRELIRCIEDRLAQRECDALEAASLRRTVHRERIR